MLLVLAGCGDSNAKDENAAKPKAPQRSSEGASALPAIEDVVDAGGERFEVPAADWIQLAGGAVWTTLAESAVIRLDPSAGRQRTRTPTKAPTCLAMDAGLGSLWVGVCSEPSMVLRIDPDDGHVLDSFRVPGILQEEGSLAVGSGAVWAVTALPEQVLVRIDPDSGKVRKQRTISGDAAGVRAGLGGLWLTDPVAGELLRVDPRTGKVVAQTKTGAGARFLDVGEGAVWVQNNDDGTVTRVDPTTNRAVATIHVDDGPISGGDLAVGGGFVWARVSGSLVAKIDPATNAVVARYGPAGGSGGVTADSDAVWITAHDIDAVYRLPLR